MYDPTVARFLQEDTYAGDKNDPLSLNLYTYCANNPLVYDDPTVHIPQILVAAAVGAGVGLAANGIADYLDDGKINSGWKSYLGAAAGVVGIVGSKVVASAAGGLGAALTLGAFGDFVGSVVDQKISTGKVNIKQAMLQVSPGGGRHGELPYIKISTTSSESSDVGKIKIVNGTEELYKASGEKNVTVIFTGGN